MRPACQDSVVLAFTAPTDSNAIRLELRYDIAGAAPLRDRRRYPFSPEVAKVVIVDGIPAHLYIQGRRLNRGRRWTEGGFYLSVDGTIAPDDLNPEPPVWAVDLMEKANQHPIVLAIRQYRASQVVIRMT